MARPSAHSYPTWRRFATTIAFTAFTSAFLAMGATSTAAAAADPVWIDPVEGFDNVLPGTTATSTMQVGYAANGPVTVTDVRLTDPSGAFTLDASGLVGRTLPDPELGPWQLVDLPVTFTPPTAGSYHAQATVVTTGGSVSHDIDGTSANPFVDIRGGDIDFGPVPLNQATTVTTTISNHGNMAADVSVSIEGSSDFTTGATTLHLPPATGDGGVLPVSVSVTLTPTHMYDQSADLVLSYGEHQTRASLKGVAYSLPGDDLDTATPITSDQFYDTTYSGWATTSGSETSIGMERGVWYKYTAAKDSVVNFTFDSDHAMIVGYQSGAGGANTWGSSSTAQVMAGDTLYVFGGFTQAYGGEQSPIRFSAVVTPLIQISLSVDPKATVEKSGALTVTGDGKSDPTSDVYVHVAVRQKSGHGYITADTLGWFNGQGRWTVSLTPSAGKFVAGPVQLDADAYAAWGADYGTRPTVSTTVKAISQKPKP